MLKYKLSKSAVKDLNNIWSYTFKKWSLIQADKYYASLIRVFQDISNNPKEGKNYSGVSTDLLGFRIGKHIIFYEIINADMVEITRILHGSMDLKSKLKKQ
jgi:toxin ParE1/3/4